MVFLRQRNLRWRRFSGKVAYYKLTKNVEALVISTANPGTRAASTVYVRYRDCLSTATQAELACAVEAAGTGTGQTLRIDYPRKGDYFIFVDGVSGTGGPVELSVTEIALPQCLNEVDDDEDGLTDYPSDPGCVEPDDRDETDPAIFHFAETVPMMTTMAKLIIQMTQGVAAAWPTENDSCGPGVRINEYPLGSQPFLEIHRTSHSQISLSRYRPWPAMRPVDYATACARWCSLYRNPIELDSLFQRRIRNAGQHSRLCSFKVVMPPPFWDATMVIPMA